jgi:hypothetical protein
VSAPAHTVRMEASDLRFPDCCAACDSAPEVTYDLRAERGVDLVAFSFAQWLDLPLPLCGACRRRRRLAGVVGALGLVATLAAIFFLPIVLTGDNVSTELALAMAIAILGLAILYRWRAHPVTDWKVLGLRARLLKLDSAFVELRFRRSAYFLRWAELNRGALGAEPTLR